MLKGSKFIYDLFEPNPTTEFKVIIVTGDHGYGKTAYANRLVGESIGYHLHKKDVCDWEAVKTHIGFHPAKVIKLFFSMRSGIRDVCYHWDDAGLWLSNTKHWDLFVQAVGDYLQTERTDWGALIFSCIHKDDIVNKIRNLRHAVIVDIIKNSDEEHPWRRHAYAWDIWKSRTGYKQGVNDLWDESFDCKMPPEFFKWYDPIREQYSEMGKKLMWKRLEQKHSDILELAKEVPI